MKLELAVIRIDGGTQARLELNQEVVTAYAEIMKEEDNFPPMTAFYDGSEYWLADGFHRFFARKSNGELEAEFDVKQGTQRDAMLFSFGSCRDRGLQLSSKDIRQIVTRILKDEEWRQWSDSQIAKHIGVSKVTVGRVRHLLEAAGELEERTSIKFKKNGKEEKAKPPSSSKKPKKTKPKTDDPEAEDSPKETPKPKTIDGIDFEDKIIELTDQITAQDAELALLRDKIAIGQWDASEIEKIDIQDTVTDLRKQIELLEMENKTLRESRDMYQNRNSELMRTVKSLTQKLKKAGIE